MGAPLRILWWNVSAPSSKRMKRQLELVFSLEPLPDVIALSEVTENALVELKEQLPDREIITPKADLAADRRRVAIAAPLGANALSIDRFKVPTEHPVAEARGNRVRPWSVVSAQIELQGRPVELHAVHIPNGSSNGWVKIDHLWAVRYGLERSDHPQVLCGDFNTPQAEKDGKIITFGQNLDGSLPSRRTTRHPFSEERPWEAAAWDEGERAILEGLPDDLDMPDLFRKLHPDAPGFTWAPYGREDLGRRLDHVYASRQLRAIRCEHIDGWRRKGISDHCPIDAALRWRS